MSQPLSYRSSLVWLGQVFAHWGRWTRAHWRMTILISAISFAVGWVWNTYIMAVDLEGSAVGPDTETIALAQGQNGNALFWLLLFCVLGGLVTYVWSRGWRLFLSDVATMPRQFGQAMTRSPGIAFAMLLWGTSISLIIATLISSAVSFALGLVLLALAATPMGVILNFALIRLWRGVYGLVAPKADARTDVSISAFMVMLGEALGLFLDWMVGGWVFGLLLGIGCAVASILVVRATPAPRATVLMFFIGVAVLVQVIWMRGAYADDGGWSECVSPDGGPCTGLTGFFDWLRSPGADEVVVRGAAGGLSAGLGAALGVGVGGAAAGLAVAAAQASATAGRPAPGQPGPSEAYESGHGATSQQDTPATQSGPLSQADPAAGPYGMTHQARFESPGLAQEGAGQAEGQGGQAAGQGGQAESQGGEVPTDPGGRYAAGGVGDVGGRGAGDISDLLPEQPDRRKDDEENSDR